MTKRGTPTAARRRPIDAREQKITRAIAKAMRDTRSSEIAPQISKGDYGTQRLATVRAAIASGSKIPSSAVGKSKRKKKRATVQQPSKKATPEQIEAEQKRKAKALAKLNRKSAAMAERAIRVRLAVEAEAVARDGERTRQATQFLSKLPEHSFSELLVHWRRHMAYLAYPRAKERSLERWEMSLRATDAIENEWARRKRDCVPADYFDWPSSEARNGVGGLDATGWVPKGMLGYLGYQVGERSKLTAEARQRLLSRIFESQLPPMLGPDGDREWAAKGSAPRLKKLANCLASFARMAKGNRLADKRKAIADWESDLKVLHDQFYVGHFGFGWPSAR